MPGAVDQLRGHDLLGLRECRQPMPAHAGADVGLEAVAPGPGLLEATSLGQRGHALVDRGDHLAGVAAERGQCLLRRDGVRIGIARSRAGCRALPQLAAHAARIATRPARQAVGAGAQGQSLVERLGRERRGTARGKGTDRREVAIAHRTHCHHARMWLAGEGEPHLALGMAGAAVVGRLVLGDEAQLAHPRLEVGGAHDRIHAVGEAHHLGHPLALLGRREIRPHARADVARGADVEGVPLRIAEDVDARRLG